MHTQHLHWAALAKQRVPNDELFFPIANFASLMSTSTASMLLSSPQPASLPPISPSFSSRVHMPPRHQVLQWLPLISLLTRSFISMVIASFPLTGVLSFSYDLCVILIHLWECQPLLLDVENASPACRFFLLLRFFSYYSYYNIMISFSISGIYIISMCTFLQMKETSHGF